ncbi:hypothetical protein [Calidithermus timidus]|jgi:hypothetical protein|uniref:hypothetical protein n=1 Tax=Calidithermus timidus TaxID=307124 RepID=UPI0003695529|nr:hypothetical protein [Calidithermus timidus]
MAVKVLFVEGKNGDKLREFARSFPNPYRLLYRKEQGLYVLEAWAVTPQMEAAVGGLEGFRAWSFELVEEGYKTGAADA